MKNFVKQDISGSVMSKINDRHTTMRSRWYFTLISYVLGVALFFVILLAIFSSSLGLFKIRHLNPFGFTDLGRAGWIVALQILPWELIIYTVFATVLTWFLIRRYDISYKIGFLSLALVVVFGIFVASFILDRNKFGEKLEENGVAIHFLEHESVGDNWAEGDILAVNGDSFVINAHSGKTQVIIINQKTQYQPNPGLAVSQRVRVLGDMRDGKLWAHLIEIEHRNTAQPFSY